MSTPPVDRISVALKDTVYKNVSSPVERILVALKATVDRNVNSYGLQDFGSSERHGLQRCQLPS